MAEGLLLRRVRSREDVEFGELIAVATNLAGSTVPQKGKYVELTAGLTGSGDYNEGLLTNESVSGSAPLVNATAEIAVGPLAGQTIRLVNTERDFLRGGSSGTFEQDQVQQHQHSASTNGATNSDVGRGGSGITVARNNFWTVTVGNSNSGRRGDETRGRNVGVTYFMRIV